MLQSEPDPNALVVIYPCFFPPSDLGERLLTATVDGTPAIVFLTDRDLADRFYREWSDGNHGKPSMLLQRNDYGELVEMVRRVESRTRPAGVKHLAIDPGGRFK